MNNSKKLFSDAKKVIPSGVNSPVRYFEPYPFFVKRSQGSFLWDEDGNQFVDFCNGYGALLLGHTRREIITAASNQIKKGTLYLKKMRDTLIVSVDSIRLFGKDSFTLSDNIEVAK